MGAKAGLGGFGLWLLVSRGFWGAKAFFSVVREGVADKPRKILCSVFLFCSGGLGLAWEPGGAGILFFLPGFYGKAGKSGRLLSAFSFAPPPYFLFLYFLCTLCFFFAIILGSGGFYGRDS